MNNYNFNYNDVTYVNTDIASKAMKRVYLKMTLALLVTAFVAYWAAGSYSFLSFIAMNSWAMWGLLIAELGLVFGISAAINKLSSPIASLLFYLFAVVNGLMLSPILLAYTETSVAKTFFMTAGVFGAMSVYGYFTNRDLTKIGNFLVMALIGLIIVSLVNIFTKSESLEWLISFIGVAIFIGLTAWDTQKIKRMAEVMPSSEVGRLATIGALSLYLDFINLFLYLLRFFGGNRD